MFDRRLGDLASGCDDRRSWKQRRVCGQLAVGVGRSANQVDIQVVLGPDPVDVGELRDRGAVTQFQSGAGLSVWLTGEGGEFDIRIALNQERNSLVDLLRQSEPLLSGDHGQ